MDMFNFITEPEKQILIGYKGDRRNIFDSLGNCTVIDTRVLALEKIIQDIRAREQIAQIVLTQFPLHKQLQGALMLDPGRTFLDNLKSQLQKLQEQIYAVNSLDELDALKSSVLQAPDKWPTP